MAVAQIAFDRAVRCFTDIKTGEGIAVISCWEEEEKGACGLQTALTFAGASASKSDQPIEELGYFFLRRFLTSVSVCVRAPGASFEHLRSSTAAPFSVGSRHLPRSSKTAVRTTSCARRIRA